MSAQGMFSGCPRPQTGEVHVWFASVSEMRPKLPVIASFLSKQEQEVAARFARPADHERYVVAHGLLRSQLGGYLSTAPEMLQFVTNDFGKPDLAFAGDAPPLKFNLAHSGDVVVCAVTLKRRVGIDVEMIRADLDVMALALRQFAGEEVDVLLTLDPAERRDSFFRCWTRKEAYAKARGEGLGYALDKFAVSFGAREAARVCWSEDDPDASKNWSMFHLDPCPGYAGAVVIEGQNVQVVSRRWK